MIKRVSAEEVLPLRALVLREGRAIATAMFPKDDHPSTAHFAYILNGEIVTVASVMKETHKSGTAKSFQLRGMATRPDCHGKGFGAQVLKACLAYVQENDGDELWCNARVSASGFYEANGFQKIDPEPFDIAGVGPHYQMHSVISPHS